MNLMVLKRFRNELMVFSATIFMLYAFYYKISANSFIENRKADVTSSIEEIDRVIELKRLWKKRGISKKIIKLKTIVTKDKIALFKKRGQKVVVKYKKLNIKELNSIVKYIMNNPFQIVRLKMDRVNKEIYSMELICRW
jgi:pyruvate/2-oxoglutarate/acetoin dehydrogenase E1 component